MKTLGLVLVILCACQENNPNYCKGAPDNNCTLGSGSGTDSGAAACTSSAQCSGATPVCDTSSSTCVACMGSDLGACAGTMPVCGTDNTCQACSKHSDCGAMGACLPTGACGTDQDTAWVSGTGSNDNACTQEAPCATITQALTHGLPYVKVSGAIHDTVSIAAGVTILADPGATLDPGNGGALVTVTATEPVEIDDLTIEYAGSSTGIGVYLPAGAQNVKLLRVTVQDNPGGGVYAIGGTITILRSVISSNSGGGITLNGASFDIENCFIVGNGSSSTTSSTGGLAIQSLGAMPYTVQFDTFADNKIKSGLGGAITCGTLGATIALDSLLIFGNESVTNTSEVLGGDCSYTYTLIGPTGTASGTGDNNITDPGFVTASPPNYHITSGSPAKDMADRNSTLANDIDGDMRPFDSIRDVGADEYTQ
ncbi:MAG TPA: right-handed parallel beta-helix repeat-containing protein [Kofleriaceae bacterium]|nr:right-handed parallel beta-helix repeat-containing protein [Kofleriaceae bacterium]